MGYPLEVKLGQMVMVGFRGAEPSECRDFLNTVRDCHLGGVWLTENESPMGLTFGNIRSPGQVKRLTAALQDVAKVPLFVAIDAEGGEVVRLKEKYGFPRFRSAQDLGERDDLAFTRAQAELLADTLVECGINFNFAPVLDLNKNPANPIIGGRARSISRDPAVVVRHAMEFIEAHHARGILCAGKHFPGHGASTTDSHEGLVDVTGVWGEDELVPYQALIEKGLLDAVLSAHVFLRQFDARLPATLSQAIIHGLLRDRLRFDGLVFSDDLNMGAISRHYPFDEAIARCVEAGVDVLLHANVDRYDPGVVEKTVAVLTALVRSGRLKEERVDESFNRVLRLKRLIGLL